MSIRKKSVISLLVIISLLLLALSYSARDIFLDRFQDLEDQALATNMQRAQKAVDGKLRTLLALTTDWAVWNDSHDFIQTRNPDYLAANFHSETLSAQGLALIAILDRDGLPIHAAYYDEQTGDIALHDSKKDAILSHADLLAADAEDFERTGILNIDGQPLLIASRAILRTDKSGDYAGTMIMARWLGQSLQDELAEETQLDLEFRPVPERFHVRDASVFRDDLFAIGTVILFDMQDRPVQLIRIRMERDITAAGRSALKTHLYALLLFGGAFTILVMFFLEKNILSRLSALTREVRKARAGALEKVTVNGRDELSMLQLSINVLFRNIRRSEASYESFFRNTGTANAVIDHNGLIHLVNAEFEHLAGQDRNELEKKVNIGCFLPECVQSLPKAPVFREGPFCSMSRELVFHGRFQDRTVLTSISPLPDRRRQILALQDISLLKASQQELINLSRELEERVKSRTLDLEAANKALAREIRQRTATALILQTTSAISLALSRAETITEALSQLLEQACGLEHISCGTAYVHDRAGGRFQLAADHGMAEEDRESLAVIEDDSDLGRTLHRGQARYDTHASFTACAGPDLNQADLRSVGIIPISFQGNVVASLHVGSRTADEIPLAIRSILETIATQTGGAIVRIVSQENLARTAKELAAIFENSAVGIIHVSAGRVILKTNQRLADMFGYTCRELIGRHIRELHVSPAASDQFEALHYGRLRAERQLLNLEQRMKTKDGEIRWYTFHGRMIDPLDPDQGFVWVVEDIHDMKTADEERSRYMEELQLARDMEEENAAKLVQMVEELDMAKEVAESASRMKSQFLANVSHEIRTPMNAIMGMTDIVLGTEINAEQRRALNIVKNSSEALLDIINGVLDQSKIEAGQFELEIRPFDLRTVVEKTISTLGLTAMEKGLDLICHLPPTLPAQVEGDPIRLRQILINLLGNAVKFTPSGHVICLCRLDHLDANSCLLHFEIEDTGIGIAVDKQKIIFEDFSQVDSTVTRVYGGTGLGLSISRKLLELMDGNLWVQSSPGQGSTFHFTVRMGRPSPPDMTHANLFEGLGPVLLVVNNPRLRDQIDMLLHFWGLETLSHSCLDDSLPPCDLALLDTDFNDQDCEQLLAPGGGLDRTPTIVLTQLGDQSHAVQGSIKAVVGKPLLYADLLRALANSFGLRLNLPDELTAAQTRKSKRSLDILLVEDVATNRELAELLLTRMGHTVHDARDGLDALTLLGRHRYDLIFMDLQMPVMDGFTATRIIRACEQDRPAPSDMDNSFLVRELRSHIGGTSTPIVAMTAHAMIQDRQRCLEIGMDDYLTKPLRPEEISRVLDNICRALPDSLAPAPNDAAPPSPGAARDDTNLVGQMFDELAARYDLDHEQALPLIVSLAESLEEHLDALPDCLHDMDKPLLAQHAHSLKGLYLNMGLTSQAATAKHLEDMARNDGPDKDLRTAGQALSELTSTILAEIRAHTTADDKEAS